LADISRLLIAGANGIVGQALPFGIKCSHQELDVTNPTSIATAYDKYNPSAILMLSSINLRSSEDNPQLAYNVNVWGTYNLAREAAKRNIPLIIISSGAIFNGPIGSQFTEEDIPSPLNIYGQTKYLAELIARNVAPKHIIIRTGWIYGDMPKRGGFASFIERTIVAAQKGETIQASSHQHGSPALMQDLVYHIKSLIESDRQGTFHVANAGSASAADMAHHIVNYFKSTSRVEVPESKLESIARSPSEVLDSKKLAMRGWKEALDYYLGSRS
jgi:dTDP-4-dehydrorhamnose reductase